GRRGEDRDQQIEDGSERDPETETGLHAPPSPPFAMHSAESMSASRSRCWARSIRAALHSAGSLPPVRVIELGSNVDGIGCKLSEPRVSGGKSGAPPSPAATYGVGMSSTLS